MIKDNSVYLQHIKEAIEQINEYLKGMTHGDFNRSKIAQDAVIRQLIVIGEATKNLSKDFRGKYIKIPWRNIAGMRDKLIHGYMGIDLEDVWKTASVDVPALHKDIIEIFQEFDSELLD